MKTQFGLVGLMTAVAIAFAAPGVSAQVDLIAESDAIDGIESSPDETPTDFVFQEIDVIEDDVVSDGAAGEIFFVVMILLLGGGFLIFLSREESKAHELNHPA
jgi:hypothetical protein